MNDDHRKRQISVTGSFKDIPDPDESDRPGIDLTSFPISLRLRPVVDDEPSIPNPLTEDTLDNTTIIEHLPVAYPVYDTNESSSVGGNNSFINDDDSQDISTQTLHSIENGESIICSVNELTKKVLLIMIVIVLSFPMFLIVSVIARTFTNSIRSQTIDENDGDENTINSVRPENNFNPPVMESDIISNSSSLLPETVDEIVSQPVSEQINNTDSTATSSQNAQEQQIEKNFTTCFTDPVVVQSLEWEAYERGDDPSVPRTYHFCPNSQINVFGFSPYIYKMDYTTGDAFPLILFRPNVNILCGEDGDYSNNCTFSGGFFHIGLAERPIFVDYDINSTTENITISGFRFTGASGGVNIVSRSRGSSLTVKNCRFDNNKDMSATINLTGGKMVKSRKLFVYNSTFDNNSYTYNDYEGSTGLHVPNPHVGVILSYPLSTSSDTRIDTHVSSCVFLNNSFNDIHDITGTIINLFPPVTKLEVTQSCFIGNSGYTSGLISLGYNSSSIMIAHESYSDNYFSENKPNNQQKLSCIVKYENITYTSDGRININPETPCGDYDNLDMRQENQVCFNQTN